MLEGRLYQRLEVIIGLRLSTSLRSYGSTNKSHCKTHLIPSSGEYPVGFQVGSSIAGIKKKGGRDLTLISSDRPCVASAVFTQNSFAAAPVIVSKEILKKNCTAIKNVLINSGCANACTGQQGLDDARTMSKALYNGKNNKSLDTAISDTLVMSTGVIGQHLNMSNLIPAIQSSRKFISSNHDGWLAGAEGIMTTDTFPKLRSKSYRDINGNIYHMAGICKGAGMIHPNMATMLSTICTDAVISQECLQSATKYAADRSFNAITVDGDTSTNDTFLVLANGASNTSSITHLNSKSFKLFQMNLTEFATELAKLIVKDGEGATKFISVQVEGANTFQDAKTIASCIATSALVKTAIYGRDANWGRVLCAVGYSGIKIIPEKINLFWLNHNERLSLHLVKDGSPYNVDEQVANEILADDEIIIRVGLGMGKASATMYTCDFSTEYVHINADYRS